MGHNQRANAEDDVARILLALNHGEPPSSMPSTSQGTSAQTNQHRGEFLYTIKWNEVPLQTLNKLTDANDCGRPAHPDDIDALKKYLMKDLFYKYESFKENHIVTTKTAGIVIYQSISLQTALKFKNCFGVQEEAKVAESELYNAFLKSFTISMENQGRRVPNVSRSVTASLAKGQVGVLNENYNPPMSEETIEAQKDAKLELQAFHLTVREKDWDKQEITKLMHWTYDLQRKDIVDAVNKIKGNGNTDEDNEGNTDEDNEDEIFTESEILKLKAEWPFLFNLRWQSDHFLKLTGFVVELALNDYVNSHLDTLILYLCSMNTEAAIKNIAIGHLWERNGKDRDIKLLVAIMMIANFFQEDYRFFIKTAEKTTNPLDVKAKVPDLEGAPSIIALDSNIYRANQFFACIDREVFITAQDIQEAVIGIIQGAFIFDAHYHEKLPRTFEFIERVICRMGNNQTMRRTKQVQVASLSVLKLVNNTKKFKERLDKYL